MNLRATPSQYEAFLEGMVWGDMVAELEVWETAARSEFDVCHDLHRLGNVQGRLEALAYLKRLPATLLEFVREEWEVKRLAMELGEAPVVEGDEEG